MNQLLDVLPEELLFTVSTYGQVPPGLTPEYILREVNRVSHRPVEWAKEFTLEYLRATDRLYRNVGDVLRIIPIDRILQAFPHNNTLVVEIEGLSVSEADHISRSVDPSVRMERLKDISTDRSLYSLSIPMKEPIDSSDDELQIRNLLYLANPRTSLDASRIRGRYSMVKSSDPGDVRRNYPWLIATMDKLGLARAFPRWFPQPPRVYRSSVYIPSDIEIIRAILRVNPKYNLGDLLNWLRARLEICHSVQESHPDMYRLVTQGIIQEIEVSRYSTALRLSMMVARSSQRREIALYLSSMGFSPDMNPLEVVRSATVDVPRDDPEGILVLQSIINSFMTVRMCLLNYSPDYIGG